jgi:hypothetical protein
MITLEILIEEPKNIVIPSDISIGYEIDRRLISDRSPSLWQNKIINEHTSATLIHIFDRGFKNSKAGRWLYEDIVDKKWARFRFVKELEADFCHLIDFALSDSDTKRIWVMSDAQFGPSPKLYSRKCEAAFLSYYQRFGIRLNSAICLTSGNGGGKVYSDGN